MMIDVVRRGTGKRAMQLGFRSIDLFDPEAPVCCRDQRRSYVWALPGKDGVLKSDPNAVRIESPAGSSVSPIPKPNRKQSTMPQTKTNRNGPARNKETGNDDRAGVEALIEQAEAVKASLRETLTNTSELIGALKKHRKQTKLVRSTLASLRQLQSIDA